MNVITLLGEIKYINIHLSLLDGKLKVDAPKGKLTVELLSRIREYRQALILELKFRENEKEIEKMLREIFRNEEAWLELNYCIDERSSIMEFDGLTEHFEACHQAELATLIDWFNERNKEQFKKVA